MTHACAYCGRPTTQPPVLAPFTPAAYLPACCPACALWSDAGEAWRARPLSLATPAELAAVVHYTDARAASAVHQDGRTCTPPDGVVWVPLS